MEDRVVANHVNHLPPSQPPTQIRQMGDELLRVPPLHRSTDNQPAAPRQHRYGQVPTPCPRVSHFSLVPAKHPPGTDLRVQVDLHFVLVDGHMVRWQRRPQPLDLPHFRVMLGVQRADRRCGRRHTKPSCTKMGRNVFATQLPAQPLANHLRQRLARPPRPADAEVHGVRLRTQPSTQPHQPGVRLIPIGSQGGVEPLTAVLAPHQRDQSNEQNSIATIVRTVWPSDKSRSTWARRATR